ncbi:MAG: hypothetical protein JNK05_25050 [Myxococcales bacterium]|nr:hypothetical protein [Myxococcales bacterium]
MTAVPCRHCPRFVRDSDARCPFCGGERDVREQFSVPATLARRTLVAMAAVVAFAGCEERAAPRDVASQDRPTAALDDATTSAPGTLSDGSGAEDSAVEDSVDATVADAAGDATAVDARSRTVVRLRSVPVIRAVSVGIRYGAPPLFDA